MRKTTISLLFTTLFLIISSGVFAQAAVDTVAEKPDKIFTVEEVKPSFKGGEKRLNKYLTENVDMQDAQRGEEAYVYFIVSSGGNVYQVQIAQSNLSVVSLEKSLVTTIEKSSGMWNSGMQNEHHVSAYCQLKITFRNNKIEAEIQ